MSFISIRQYPGIYTTLHIDHVTQIHSYTSFPTIRKIQSIWIYLSKETIDTISRLYAHTSLPTFWGTQIYVYSQNITSQESNWYNITALHTYKSSEPLGNTNIRVHPTLNHRKEFNIIYWLYTHTGLPNLWRIQLYVYYQSLHLNKLINIITQPHTHSSLRNLWRIQVYMHSKCMTSHKTHM
jgi:hypothetical protein